MRTRSLSKYARGSKIDAPCSFKEYSCSLARIDGFKFCIRHILEDKTSPFRQCNFIFPSSNKRCFRASPLTDRTEGFCEEHSNQAVLARNKAKYQERPGETPEFYVEKLTHHLIDPSSSVKDVLPDPSTATSLSDMAFEFSSEDESRQVEPLALKDLPKLEDDHDFEGASMDEDPLEHAGVYTTEEVAKIYMQKLVSLKSMYQDEFKNLLSDLKEGRREYLQALKVEKESLKSIRAQTKETSAERRAYKELKAMLRYHRPHGKEAILQHRLSEKRLRQGENISSKVSSLPKCVHSQGSWKCGAVVVPLSKYCFKHILEDPHQILFQACSASPMEGVDECEVPIIPLPHTPACVYHTPLPDIIPISMLPPESSPSPVKQSSNIKPTVDSPAEVAEGDR